MTVFADSSALVKLYADEAGYEPVRTIPHFVVSQLARVEVPAALWRKQRLGEIGPEDARVLTRDFEADYFGDDGEAPRFAVVAVRQDVLDDAARLCAVHGLRAYDGAQLASALAARATGECETFAAFDSQLRRAAGSEAFTLLF
ncbi:MAG: type II toxin-antitoxin system VapC family toxin [Trebonia sp.]